MAEVAPAAPPAPATATAKVQKKKGSSKPKPRTGPSVGEMIVQILKESKERKGESLAAIKKKLAARGYDVDKNRKRILLALKKQVDSGVLVQIKGSYKIKKADKTDKKPAAKKPGAKKPARKTVKAARPAKSPGAKKPSGTPKKTAAAKKSKPSSAKKPAKSTTKKSPSKKKEALLRATHTHSKSSLNMKGV
uniref:H15 domain-containing protein n=1 Tax=Myripristis murdjan TaxID=586833 RepID=A0A667W8L3_9TELE